MRKMNHEIMLETETLLRLLADDEKTVFPVSVMIRSKAPVSRSGPMTDFRYDDALAIYRTKEDLLDFIGSGDFTTCSVARFLLREDGASVDMWKYARMQVSSDELLYADLCSIFPERRLKNIYVDADAAETELVYRAVTRRSVRGTNAGAVSITHV